MAIGDPLYVVRLDAAKRQVIVGPREALLVRRIHLKEVTWLGDGNGEDAARANMPVAVKVRSTRPPAPAHLVWDEASPSGWAVDLAEAEEGVAPGQACVFYSPEEGYDRVLGGGWIARAEPMSAAA